MEKELLIKALRNCSDGMCSLCPYDDHELSTKGCEAKLMHAAADALEVADERIEQLEKRTKLPDRQEFLAKGSFIEEPLSRPKGGVWIWDDTTYCGAGRANYKCSLCGKIGGTWKRGLTQDELPNYCANCGCAMGGEKK